MALISEATSRLQMSNFFSVVDKSKYSELLENVSNLQNLFQEYVRFDDPVPYASQWNLCQEKMVAFSNDFEIYCDDGCKKSQRFQYWDAFIHKIMPVLRDLTQTHREGDWSLHLSSVCQAIPLTFAFARINYKRWLPIYYEDCLQLEERYPLLYNAFIQGDFVVKHSNKSLFFLWTRLWKKPTINLPKTTLES